MRIERVVINASPLITLFRAGLHPLQKAKHRELERYFPYLLLVGAWVDRLGPSAAQRSFQTSIRQSQW